jgi:uncharacterized protein YecE (DUF72 family)
MFHKKTAEEFFKNLRYFYPYPVMIEPRHLSWTSKEALQLQKEFNLSKVFADPSPCPIPVEEAPLTDTIYFRLHGSPEIYKSEYSLARLRGLSAKMRQWRQLDKEVWCVFDNTTYGHATKNAIELLKFSRHDDSRSAIEDFYII